MKSNTARSHHQTEPGHDQCTCHFCGSSSWWTTATYTEIETPYRSLRKSQGKRHTWQCAVSTIKKIMERVRMSSWTSSWTKWSKPEKLGTFRFVHEWRDGSSLADTGLSVCCMCTLVPTIENFANTPWREFFRYTLVQRWTDLDRLQETSRWQTQHSHVAQCTCPVTRNVAFHRTMNNAQERNTLDSLSRGLCKMATDRKQRVPKYVPCVRRSGTTWPVFRCCIHQRQLSMHSLAFSAHAGPPSKCKKRKTRFCWPFSLSLRPPCWIGVR